jgi:hypothetical protein
VQRPKMGHHHRDAAAALEPRQRALNPPGSGLGSGTMGNCERSAGTPSDHDALHPARVVLPSTAPSRVASPPVGDSRAGRWIPGARRRGAES